MIIMKFFGFIMNFIFSNLCEQNQNQQQAGSGVPVGNVGVGNVGNVGNVVGNVNVGLGAMPQQQQLQHMMQPQQQRLQQMHQMIPQQTQVCDGFYFFLS